MRSCVSSRTGFTPFQLEWGVPFSWHVQHHFWRLSFILIKLKVTLLVFSQQADPEDAVTSEPGIPNTPEWVLLKASKREWLELRWTSLFQTTHAVRLKRKFPFSLMSNKTFPTIFVPKRSNFTCLNWTGTTTMVSLIYVIAGLVLLCCCCCIICICSLCKLPYYKSHRRKATQAL